MKAIKNKTGIHEEFTMVKGVLVHIQKVVQNNMERTYYQICVPRRMAPELVGKFHESIFAQHGHVKKLIQNLNHRFFIKMVQKIVTAVIDMREICQLNKPNTRKQGLGNKLIVNGPGQLILMDICMMDKKILAMWMLGLYTLSLYMYKIISHPMRSFTSLLCTTYNSLVYLHWGFSLMERDISPADSATLFVQLLASGNLESVQNNHRATWLKRGHRWILEGL